VVRITAERRRFSSTHRAPRAGNTAEPVDHKREETTEHDHTECDGAAAAEKVEEMREDPVDHRADARDDRRRLILVEIGENRRRVHLAEIVLRLL
jgi:hypothetical protein